MKIILEFASWEEHDQYVSAEAKRSEPSYEPGTALSLAGNKGKAWTEYEMEVVRSHWGLKSAKWIAQSLGRTTASVNQLAVKMRRMGADLPRKRKANGTVIHS